MAFEQYDPQDRANPLSNVLTSPPRLFSHHQNSCSDGGFILELTSRVGGWPRLLTSPAQPQKWVGTMQHAVPILTTTKSHDTGSILPALAKNARAGHPPL